MTYTRVASGQYRSACGRAEIRKAVSQQTRRKDEVCWVVIIDGKELAFAYETLKDAKYAASKRLEG